jgi:hypothetical protein
MGTLALTTLELPGGRMTGCSEIGSDVPSGNAI